MINTPTSPTNITFLLLDNMLATSSTLPSEMLLAAKSAATVTQKASPNINLRTASQQSY